MALPIVKSLYGRMGKTFTNIFGSTVIMRHPEIGEVEIDAVVSPGYSISAIRGEASQTRDMWTLSMRREQVSGLLSGYDDIVFQVQRCEFIYEGNTYKLDDVVDDTQIMIEGFMYVPSSSPSSPSAPSGDRLIKKESGILR